MLPQTYPFYPSRPWESLIQGLKFKMRQPNSRSGIQDQKSSPLAHSPLHHSSNRWFPRFDQMNILYNRVHCINLTKMALFAFSESLKRVVT